MPEHSSSQRTSIALFLATAGMIGGSAALPAPADAAFYGPFSADRSQLLADISDCIPVGEGENCERESRNKRKKRSTANPAADDSSPTSNPGASDDSAADQLNLIEKGDL